MAASTTGKQFRLTLVRVSKILTGKNVRDLASLCDTIPPAKQEELNDALDLFRALQGHDLLSENKVNTLIEWLEELKLMEASSLLRDYKSQHLEPGDTPRAMCHIHKNVPLKYVCESCELAKKGESDITNRRGESDGAFRVTSVGTLVGAVSLKQDQLLMIFDERNSTGMVWLVCIDPGDPRKEYWRDSMKVDDHRSPVVCSHVDMYYDGNNHVPIAVGNIVYLVRPHWTGESYDDVQEMKPMVIDEVPEGSWITCITVRWTAGEEDQTEFMVALNRLSVIIQYNISGLLIKSIETNGLVFSSGISGLACSNTTLAVLGRDSDDVILISVAEETVKQCGCLKPTSAGFIPTIITWTGHQWLLLFMTSDEEKKWKVVKYYEKGKMFREYLLEARPGMPVEFDILISLAWWSSTGYVISASKIRAFKY